MPKISFTVDAALLRELGERLVGRPHIALAELVKNAYDADATAVEIEVGEDYITVSDNGHGMTMREFADYFMRIGSPHKEHAEKSRRYARPLTGSKGVGRLAVQFLASELHLSTTSCKDQSIQASVDWRVAVQAEDITKAEVEYSLSKDRAIPSPNDALHGTTIRLTSLRHNWTTANFEDLAREVWALQSPFRNQDQRQSDGFRVVLQSADDNLVERFDAQMRAWLHLWHAKISGAPAHPQPPASGFTIRLAVQFAGEEPIYANYTIADCPLQDVDFELRVFSLHHRQKFGIPVNEARTYLRKNGGIHIYDSGFHLPYYGPDTDWLGIEVAHSHRLSVSTLLPRDLQVRDGLRHLPTNTRLFGVVNVNTSLERRAAQTANPEDILQISVSRDRLLHNHAFQSLADTVRWALDFYAMREAERAHTSAAKIRQTAHLPTSLDTLGDLLRTHESTIPRRTYNQLDSALKQVAKAGRASEQLMESRSAMLATLASAGMAQLALQHDTDVRLTELRRLAVRLDHLVETDAESTQEMLRATASAMRDHVDSIQDASRIFNVLLDPEDRDERIRLPAGPTVTQVLSQVSVLLKGVPIDTSRLLADQLLPAASLAEWTAFFQNVLVNSVNAMLDCPEQRIMVQSRHADGIQAIVVEDTGIGVDIDASERLFDPFVRELQLSPERRQLGLGGTGLGLTIARMIASSARCQVRFVPPSEDYSTAIAIEWKEGG